MLHIAIFTLALVVGQVVTHPTHPIDVTLNDDGDQGYPLDEVEEEVELLSAELPFWMTNPSQVAAGELYQSDMLLDEEQRDALRLRKAKDNDNYRWTEGPDGNPLVPYVYQDAVDQADVTAALDHWMEHTCIKFEETSNTDQPHLQFHIGSGCWSYVGMTYYANGQQVSIGSGCNSLGTIVHEVGHAIGFHHEQSRSDRDDHVIIIMDNVQDGKGHNFDKEVDNNYSVPYDYSSNMHYGMSYFSKNGGPTIVTKDPMAQELIGSRHGLTHRDKLLANIMYDCIGKWLTSCSLSSDPCTNGGYTGKDCTCICPPGTSGSNCEEIVDDYYAELRNPLSEKITTEQTITIETPMDAGISFTKWIVPPTCQKAKLTFTSSDMYSSCNYQYLNVKTDAADLVGETMCAEDVSNGVTLTSDTGIIITMTNYVSYGFQMTLWEADVTFEDIPECGSTEPPTEPTTQPPTQPSTPAPTKPTKPPVPTLPCQKKPKTKVLKRGKSITITSPKFPKPYSKDKISCGWKLKAEKKKGSLKITCDKFALKGKDKLQIFRKSFKGKKAPTLSSKKLTIKFKSNKKSSGPGFSCTVVSK